MLAKYCLLLLSLFLLLTLSISCQREEVSNKYNFSAYPNPFKGIIYGYVNGPIANGVTISVHNEKHEAVKRIDIAPNTGNTQVSIDLRDQPVGVYLLQADFKDRIEIIKIYKY